MLQTTPYYARFQRVLDYIDEHLDTPLSVDELSEVCAFSKFHFHRQFTALLGVSLTRFIQVKRLKRASQRLAYREASITEIALDSGFESPEAFSRAFKRHFGQSPTQFRSHPEWDHWLTHHASDTQVRPLPMTKAYQITDVDVVDFPETRLAVLEHHGSPRGLPDSIRTFIAWRKAHGAPPSQSATFNILHNNINTVAAEDYRFDIGAEVKSSVAENPFGVIEKTLPAGRCAKLRITGSDDHLEEAMTFIYGEWLPDSFLEPRDVPPFLQRVSFFPDVAEHEAVTDIFLPVK